MEIFDSELTARGTFRKVIYSKGSEHNKEARKIAEKDITAESRISREPKIKPWRDPVYSNQEYDTYLEKWKIEQPKESFTAWFKKEKEKRKILAFLNRK